MNENHVYFYSIVVSEVTVCMVKHSIVQHCERTETYNRSLLVKQQPTSDQ
ncbi:hypothetical protein [Priestia koreensis]|nr:hypothetical protein [Priestia koreensis]